MLKKIVVWLLSWFRPSASGSAAAIPNNAAINGKAAAINGSFTAASNNGHGLKHGVCYSRSKNYPSPQTSPSDPQGRDFATAIKASTKPVAKPSPQTSPANLQRETEAYPALQRASPISIAAPAGAAAWKITDTRPMPPPHEQAKQFFAWLKPRVGGRNLYVDEAKELYAAFCKQKGYEPRPWNRIARFLNLETKAQRGGDIGDRYDENGERHRVRVFRIPLPGMPAVPAPRRRTKRKPPIGDRGPSLSTRTPERHHTL